MRVLDLVGRIFERLTVIERDYTRSTKRARWLCECNCESKNTISVASGNLVQGITKSCGCLSKNSPNVGIKRYNRYDITGEYGIGYTFKNQEFYFDLEDYDLIKDYSWSMNPKGYIGTTHDPEGNIKGISMHRLVMNVTDKNVFVDHIHHILNDNRKGELRSTTRSQNSMNQTISKINKSGVTGVYWNKTSGYWMSYININKEQTVLGKYKNFNDAVRARKNAEEKYYGEFSYDNSMKLNTEDQDNLINSTT